MGTFWLGGLISRVEGSGGSSRSPAGREFEGSNDGRTVQTTALVAHGPAVQTNSGGENLVIAERFCWSASHRCSELLSIAATA